MSIKKLIPAILIGTLACVNLAGCTSSKDREAQGRNFCRLPIL